MELILATCMALNTTLRAAGEQSRRTEPQSRSYGDASVPGKLCHRDLHDMDRESAEQTASKKRRSELSSFSIAATLSCDDLSRADTDGELRCRHELPCIQRCISDMQLADFLKVQGI